MSSLTLQFLIHALTGQQIPGATPITTTVFDSREIVPGALFAALRGEGGDGHAHVADAFAQRAIAALIDQPVDVPYPSVDLTPRPPLHPVERGSRAERDGGEVLPPLQTPVCLLVPDSLLALQSAARKWLTHVSPRVIGITGSVGKTTTKEVVAGVLARRYRVHKNDKSYNNEIGLPVSVLRMSDDTQKAVLEMSMYFPGEIKLLVGIAPPHVGLVTNISPVHLERAGTLQRIIDAKAELVEPLPADGLAILNRDDEHVMSMAARTRARIFTYGLDAGADLVADEVEGLGLDGVAFRLHYGGESRRVRLPLVGRHHVYTALAAAAVGLTEGLGWDDIAAGLEGMEASPRLVPLKGPHDTILLDDTYNASPVAMVAALNLLADLKARRNVAVLGDMLELGDYEEEGHRKVGRRAAEVADVLITVGPRGKIIAQEALHGGMITAHVRSVESAEEAITFLKDAIQPGDAILVKGSRAVKMERIVAALRTASESGA